MTGTAGRKATLVLLSNAAGAALGYVSLLLIGRYFEPDAYGHYVFAFSVTGLIAVATNLGLGSAHQRHIAQGVDVGRAMGVLLRLRLLVAVPLLALFALAYLAWSAASGEPLTDATTPTVLALVLTLQVMSGARQALLDTWQGEQKVHRVETIRGLDSALTVALLANAALLVAHLEGRWEVLPGVGAFWAGVLGLEAPLGIAASAVLLSSCFLAAKALSFLAAWGWWMGDRVQSGPWDPELARSYVRFALPLAAGGLLLLALQYTDSIVLGYFWTSREVGLYGAAQRLCNVLMLGSTAAGAVLFPRFAELHARGDLEEESRTFRRAERYLLLLVVPMAAAMAALPREGLHVAVGDAFLDADAPLRALALWAVVATAEQPLAVRLMGGGHARVMARAAAFNVAANLVLNLVFVPPAGLGLGPGGAALATFLSTAVSYAYVRWMARRLHGIPWVAAYHVRILAAGAAAAAFWMLAARALGPEAFDRAWELVGWGLAGVALYALLLVVLRELHGRDLRFVRHAAHPGALLRELRGR